MGDSLTIESAIKRAEEVAEENEKFCYKKGGEGGYFNEETDWNNSKCAAEHRKLAEWLKDYKRLLERESCEDAISRQAVSEAVSRIGLCKCNTNEIEAVGECLRAVEDLPPVTLQPNTGHWIHLKHMCGNANYCPNCGARMIEPPESEDKE